MPVPASSQHHPSIIPAFCGLNLSQTDYRMTESWWGDVVAQKLQIKNRDLRRLWLAANGLMSERVNAGVEGVDVMRIIRKLGFLQIDTVRNIARAHHHILWSRNQHYSEAMLWPLLRHRKLFEHFTHDASLIPMEVYPIWQRQFRRLGKKPAQASWYQSGLAQQEIRAIRDRIEAEGPLSTHAFDTKTDSREMWSRPPHKRALEQMWLAGELDVAAFLGYRLPPLLFQNPHQFAAVADFHTQSLGFCPSLTPCMYSHTLFSGRLTSF